MKTLCRQYQLTIACCLILISPMQVLAENDMRGMKMYVFEPQNDNDTVLAVKSTQGNGAEKKLKMVVFDGGAASQIPVLPLPKEHGQNIGIPADDLAPVILDKYPRNRRQEDDMQIKTYGELGYRHDRLKWNKAAPSGTPNILSELQWNNVQSAVISGGTDITFADNWQAEGKISYGQIASGKNQDSDYLLNNRQGEFSRSNNAVNDGMSIDLSADLGYHLTIGRNNRAPYWRFTPKLGYAFHTQQFNMTQGMQTIPATGSFSGLDSTYEGTWFGPWGGLTTQLAFTERFSLQGGMEYHSIDYEGTGHWNLRSDLQQPISFKHKAEGEGILATAVARYMLTPDWVIRLSAEYQNWLANKNGKDTMLGANGSTLEMKFNEVKWQSYGINVGVEYVF
ncbi:MAG: TonB-dependent receptor [Gammaproteobacteria bacterium]